MALLFCDGFDHYATADLGSKWSSVGSGVITAGGRFGTGSYIHSPSGIERTLNTADTTVIIGAAVRRSPNPAQNTCFYLKDSTAASFQIQVFFNQDHTISVIGGTTVTTTWAAQPNTWYYIEVKIVIADGVAGSVEVRVDGVTVLLSTGIDTKASAVAGYSVIGSTFSTNDLDDLYVCDSTGARNNDFLGDTRIETLLPQTDAVAAGTNHGLTPSTGTDHGALVDEATPNGDTDYNSGTTAALKDTYNYPSMSATVTTIRAVQTCLYVKKTDQTGKTINPVIRSAAADFDGTVVNVPATYNYLLQVYETDPGTAAAWGSAGVNAAEVGMKVVA